MSVRSALHNRGCRTTESPCLPLRRLDCVGNVSFIHSCFEKACFFTSAVNTVTTASAQVQCACGASKDIFVLRVLFNATQVASSFDVTRPCVSEARLRPRNDARPHSGFGSGLHLLRRELSTFRLALQSASDAWISVSASPLCAHFLLCIHGVASVHSVCTSTRRVKLLQSYGNSSRF